MHISIDMRMLKHALTHARTHARTHAHTQLIRPQISESTLYKFNSVNLVFDKLTR